MWQQSTYAYQGSSTRKRQTLGLKTGFIGGPKAAFTAAAFSATAPWDSERELRKAFIPTGDICLDYAEGQIPKTKQRCISRAFFETADKYRIMICMGWNPASFTKMVVDTFVQPVLNLLPASLRSIFVAAITHQVQTLGPKFDLFMTIGPQVLGFSFGMKDLWFLWYHSIGNIWMRLKQVLLTWVQFDIKNELTGLHPHSQLSSVTTVRDYALDSQADRMARVYSTDNDATCPSKQLNCPQHIPVRDAQLTGFRYGNAMLPDRTHKEHPDLVTIAGGAYMTGFPGPISSQLGSYDVSVNGIKGSLCLKLPVCDTKLFERTGSLYSEAGSLMDCSGHGRCTWNARRGNHCQCDQGYVYNTEQQWCCKEGQNTAQCQLSAQAKPNGTERGKPEEYRGEISQRLMSVISKLVKTEVKKKIFANQSTGKEAEDALVLLQLKEEAQKASDDSSEQNENTLDASPAPETPKKDQNSDSGCQFGILGCKIPALTTSITVKEPFFRGSEVTSLVCRNLTEARCKQRSGCTWEKGTCSDAASWTCAVRKKLLNCDATYMYAPKGMGSQIDSMCGKLLLGQKRTRKKVCLLGPRRNMECATDEQCGPPGVGTTCKEWKALEGCGNKVVHPCHALGMQEAGLMLI